MASIEVRVLAEKRVPIGKTNFEFRTLFPVSLQHSERTIIGGGRYIELRLILRKIAFASWQGTGLIVCPQVDTVWASHRCGVLARLWIDLSVSEAPLEDRGKQDELKAPTPKGSGKLSSGAEAQF